MTLSPLAPSRFPAMSDVPGMAIGAVGAGLRYQGRPDLLLAVFAAGTAAAGVFTRSRAPSAAVDWCRAALHASGGAARALVVNAGNANAFTGRAGVDAVQVIAGYGADLVGCTRNEVLQASTGVIGEPLDTAPFQPALETLGRSLKTCNWAAAADAIRTTDTFPKGSSRTTLIDGKRVVLSGIAKGSGMIMPDMATMLAFIATNARLPADVLQDLLRDATDKSFNAITVDSDTSTSDTVLMFATATDAAHGAITRADDPRLADFRSALAALSLDLAQQIVRDGEGASKFVTVTVTGAESDRAAKTIALAIGNSPLVKTAIAGEDPNWGRIVMAVGKSGEAADRDRIRIEIGPVLVAENGEVHCDYREADAAAHMRQSDIELAVDVGVGKGVATIWTCDLTHDYIRINADYRS